VEKRGTPAAGKVPDDGTLAAERTHVAVYIGRVLDVFDNDVRVREKQAIDNLGRGLGPHGDDFRAVLVELAPFLDAAKRLSRENAIRAQLTRRLIHNFRLMTDELARRDRQVTTLVSAGNAALTELGSVDRPLSAFIEQMPPMLRQLPVSFGTLRAASDELDPAFDALRPAAAALPSGLTALERLGPDLSAGAAALRRPMPRLRRLVVASGPVGRDLGAAFKRLRPAAPRLNSITAQIVPCELAVAKFFQWSLSVTKFSDVHGAFPRGEDVGSANTAGGQVRGPALKANPSCAKGGPRK
jgi:phospholipid/cholesterol/gamma-HCH transport system substrate-binding protein